jgi:cytochrome P450
MPATTTHESPAASAHRSSAKRRPPLVKSLPLIGPVREFLGDVHPYLNEQRRIHGDAFRLRVVGREMTCLCGDDAIALLDRGSVLRTGESMHVLDSELQSCLPSTFDGPQHRMFRRAHLDFLTANLESKRRGDIQERLEHHTAEWKVGDSVDVLHEAQVQTVDVLSVLLNGEPFPFTKKELALTVHMLIWATYGNLPSWLLKFPNYLSIKKKIRQHMIGLIERIRSDPERASSTLAGRYLDLEPPTGRDRWENGDLAAVPYSAYLAGFDTVASASSFLIYQLLTHPEHLQKVREEYDRLAADDDGSVAPAKQKHMRAAFLETVRLNPPGTVVIRYADRDFEFGQYTIRKGDEVIVMIASDHLDETIFENPTQFDPTRFFGEGSSPLKRKVRPFGSGGHRCTGAVLGELIAVEMASYWVNRFDLEIVPKGYVPRAVARPFTQPVGLKVKVLARR